MRRVGRTTAEGPPILHAAWLDMAVLTMHCLAHLIDRAIGISMADKPAHPAAIVSPPRFVTRATATARLAGIRLALPFERNPLCCQFVGEQGDLAPMRPAAD